ncbi:MAG TPA: twin-arginine translocase TatA/TatE family subunit [Microthrixaceae bacterium]|nr:twin-arginine translocase TatA/TatE family subunit [Microthrixaceae bacterium]
MMSGNEWIIVVIVAVLLFGGSQIPKLARSLGQAQKEFKKGIAEGSADDEDPEEGDEDPKPSGRRSSKK